MVATKTKPTVTKEVVETVDTVVVEEKNAAVKMEVKLVEPQQQKTVYTELSRIQSQLNVPKNSFNSFGKYKYRNIESILEAYKIVKGDTVLVISDDIVVIEERFYVRATATLHYNGESINNTAYAREPLTKKGMDDSQVTGATSSYARKYALGGLFAIDDNQDADSMNNTVQNAPIDVKIVENYKKQLNETKSTTELKDVWVSLSNEIPNTDPSYKTLFNIKEELKTKFTSK